MTDIISGFQLGGDSSRWDDIVETPEVPDFQKAYDKGWRYNYLKATQGIWTDRSFLRDRANCRKTPLLLGFYHFLQWDIDPRKQADYFWSVVKDDPGELPLIVDFEWWSVIPSNAFDILYNFLERMKELTDHELGIYTAFWFWKEHGRNQSYWLQYKLWLAHYNETPPTEEEIPLPWKEVFLWQKSGKGDGKYYGMESNDVDIDEMPTEIFNYYVKIEIPSEDQDEIPREEKEMQVKVIATLGLKLREGPSTQDRFIRTLPTETILTVYDLYGGEAPCSFWVKVSKDKEEWCCFKNSYGTYLEVIK